MKRIILTSAGFENKNIESIFLNMLDKPVDNARVLWIPTAAIDADAKAVLPKCMNDLLFAGIYKDNITIYNLDYEMQYDELKTFDAVYVCGGDCDYLLRQMLKVDFINLIKQYILNDGIYIGVSAGSCICGNGYKNGFNWLSSVVDVHCQKGTKSGNIASNRYKRINLKDNQAIIFYADGVFIAE